MKGNYDIFLIVLLVFIGVALSFFFAPFFGELGLLILEGIIAVAIIILLIRYFRRRK